MYYLYRYLDPKSNEWLYIGQTKNLYARHLNHLSNKKEQWCNNSIIMQYLEVPDKYNLDFLEMYLINKELPQFNTAGKNRMNTDFIKLNTDYKWKTYTKDDFIKNSIEKGESLGVSYKLNHENYNLLKKLASENRLKKIRYANGKIEAEFNPDYEIIKSKSEIYLLGVEYRGLGVSGARNIINTYCNWESDRENNFISGQIIFYLDIFYLRKIIDSLYEPTEELYELIDIVNEFLEIIGIKKDWEKVLNHIENK
ncbi:MAG: GIY-YIG nuclease family protein [Paraclostridium sordellii]